MNFSKDRRIQILSILSFFAVLFTIFPDTIAVIARRFCPCLAQDICQKLLTCFAA